MNDRTMTQDQLNAMDEAASDRDGVSTADMAQAMEQSRARGMRPSVQPELNDDPAGAEPLFPGDEAGQLRTRWTEIQTAFVDEPRRAVEQADELVAEVIKRLAQVFADERQTLESQWGQSDTADTEALRMALRRYRSFFERLLAA